MGRRASGWGEGLARALVRHTRQVKSSSHTAPTHQRLPRSQGQEHRVLLAIYLPINGAAWQWRRPEELLPYEAHAAAKESEANAAIRSGRCRQAEKLAQALSGALDWVGGFRAAIGSEWGWEER